jgi:dTDP-4-dehydrorhamnose reductase
MTILIIGGSGVIGWNLLKNFIKQNLDVKYTFKKNQVNDKKGYFLDITNQKETEKLITKINPDIVIHAVALTNVDLCEREKKMANQINVDGTYNVIKSCQKINSKIIYMSTSFVFSENEKAYTEMDVPSNPKTNYGLTKLKGEKLILESQLKSLILRIDQPYFWKQPWQHTNSVLRVIDALSKKQEFKEITDWYNIPTYIPDFLNAVDALIKNNHTGIFHLTGSDFISRFDWALKTAEIFGLDKKLLIPIKSDQLNLDAQRENINLNNEKITNETGIKMKGIKEGLLDMKNTDFTDSV